MKTRHILYNPLAGCGNCLDDAGMLDVIYDVTEYRDITKPIDYREYFSLLAPDDEVIICGGDGTLSRFANDTRDISIRNPIYYFACGRNNDFVRDLGLGINSEPSFRVNDYLRPLPTVSVNGESRLFINSVGFGLDSFCCPQRSRDSDKRDSSTACKARLSFAALKALCRDWKPRIATISVDGVSQSFENVWLCSTFHGRYYCGGIMAAPEQDRLAPDRGISLLVIHGGGPLAALSLYPALTRGRHPRRKRQVSILRGKNIKVEFDSSAPLQVDGECFPSVSRYEARAAEWDYGIKEEK